jgi:hypothetical protein
VRPTQGQDTVFATYWCTTGAFANGLRRETRLAPVKHTIAQSNTIFLVQQSNGGKNRLRADERLNAFKYSMLSRNTIVTRQDIIAFCEMQLGKSVRKISVENGYQSDAMQQQNYRRTIDVKLTPAQEGNAADWQLSCERLQAQLQMRSTMGSYYRVVIAG